MQPERIEKIKKLIENSSILSLPEKQDWLSMLELMNDKQLLELERILEPIVVKPAVVPEPIKQNLPKPVLNIPKTETPKPVKPSPIAEIVKKFKAQSLPPLPKQPQIPAFPHPQVPVAPQKVLPKTQPVAQATTKNIENPKVETSATAGSVKPEPKESFHHILNLPRVNARANSVQKLVNTPKAVEPEKKLEPVVPKIQLKPPVVNTLPEQKPAQTGFFKKLKEILNEKELTAPLPKPIPATPKVEPITQSNASSGLSFSAPIQISTNQPIIIQAPPVVPKPPEKVAEKVLEVKPVTPEKLKANLVETFTEKLSSQEKNPQQASAPVTKVEPAPNIAYEKPEAPVLKVAPASKIVYEQSKTVIAEKPIIQKKRDVNINELVEKLSKSIPPAPTQTPAISSGIKMVSNSAEAKAQLIQSAKEIKTQTAESSLSKISGPTSNYDSLLQLENFDKKFLQTSTENVVKNLQDLVARFGYHKVIFALEKSPVYKLYINTGTVMLLNQNESSWQNSPQTLSKIEFENFADILRQIQMSK
jgi:hypothetical protein